MTYLHEPSTWTNKDEVLSCAWVAFSPNGSISQWHTSRLRRWWQKRRGWTFYDGNGQRV